MRLDRVVVPERRAAGRARRLPQRRRRVGGGRRDVGQCMARRAPGGRGRGARARRGAARAASRAALDRGGARGGYGRRAAQAAGPPRGSAGSGMRLLYGSPPASKRDLAERGRALANEVAGYRDVADYFGASRAVSYTHLTLPTSD